MAPTASMPPSWNVRAIDVADNRRAGATRVMPTPSPRARRLGTRRVWLAWLAALMTGSVGAGPPAIPATGTVEVLFTPWDDAEGAIVRTLGEAQQSIHVQAFLLTSRPVARALLAAQVRGVRVELLADREMLVKGENSQLPALARGGVPVWLETRYAAAHNKVLLVDAESDAGTVITGSYNFTWSAQARNAENLLILRGNPALARRYLDNWRRHRDEAQRFDGAMNERQ